MTAPTIQKIFPEAQPSLMEAMFLRSIETLNEDIKVTSDNAAYQSLSPVEWIEKHFYLYDTEELITFHERQRRPLELAFERDENGWYRYNTVLWSWPKKSAKSSVIAAVCLYILCTKKRASVKLVANDQKQSDSRVGYYLREAIKIAKEKGLDIGPFKITPSGYTIENLSNGARCEMLPIDPSGESGGNDDLIVYSELHGWKSAAHQKMFAEMAHSPNKFGNSQIYVDTYAGYVGESPILEGMYQTGVTEGQQILGDDWEVYANPIARQLSTWVTEHWLPWQTNAEGLAYYESEAKKLTPDEFDRMHRNQWVSSTSAFIPIEWWNACKIETVPPLDKYKEVTVGIDAGVSNDCFGITAVSRNGDIVAVRYAHKWTPPKGGKLQFSNPDDKNDIEYPEGVLRWLAREFNVIVFGYDPSQLHHLCTSLQSDGVGLFQEITQGKPRLEADKQLYDIIRDRRIVHDGDVDLTQHIKNANQKIDPEDHQLRIVKRADALKIDLAVALSMAVYVGLKYLPE